MRRFGVMLGSLLVVLVLFMSMAVADEAIIDGKTAETVHLRAGRSSSSASLGLYFTGTRVLCEADPVGEWVAVTIGSQTGYMKSEFLLRGSMGSASGAKQTGVVSNPNSSWVNLRQGPSESTAALKRLNNQTILSLLGETKSGWYYVQAGDMYGYVRADLISRQAAALKPTATATPAAASSFPFTQTTQWVLSSGAGAWSTTVTLFADGTFTGYYSDWDAGETDAAYPNGTHYESVFSGRFSNVTKVSDKEHRLVITELTLNGREGDIRLADGVRTMIQSPAGLSLGDEFSVYSSGTRQSAVPQEYFSWVKNNMSNGKLKNAALYNRSQECGFAKE